jgi:hypothetical protein
MANADVKVWGRIRQLLQGFDQASSGDEESMTLTEQLEQLVALGSSAYEETTKIGRSFKAGITAAVAAVVAIPTTAHMYAIYNNEPDGGRSYIVDRIWAQNVVSTAVVCQAQILALVGQVREVAPTDATPANTLVKLNGYGSQGSNKVDSKVISILTATALPATTGLAGLWMPQGQSATKPSAVGTPGYGLEAVINGRIIVPPGRYFAMHVLANVIGETFVCGVEWHEKSIKLG